MNSRPSGRVLSPLTVFKQRFGLILGMLAAICLTAGAMIASTASA